MKIEAPDDLIAVDHQARLFARVVERLDLSRLTTDVKSVEHGGGRPVLCRGMLLTLWLYATSRGIGSAREIERHTTSDDGFKWIVGDLDVGRAAIAEFRVSHGEALLGLMADVLAALIHKGALSLDVVALDGTRTRASASAPSFRRFDSLVELLQSRQIKARRHADWDTLHTALTLKPAIPKSPTPPAAPAIKPLSPGVEKVLSYLTKSPNNRPKKSATLVRQAKSYLGKDATDAMAESVVEELRRGKKITIDEKGGLTYLLG